MGRLRWLAGESSRKQRVEQREEAYGLLNGEVSLERGSHEVLVERRREESHSAEQNKTSNNCHLDQCVFDAKTQCILH